MRLFLDLTNAEGYSSPYIELCTSLEQANNLFNKELRDYIFSGFTLEETNKLTNAIFSYKDEDEGDAWGIHILNVSPGDCVCINTNHVNEIKTIGDCDFMGMLKKMGIKNSDIEEQEEEERNDIVGHQLVITNVETKEGTLYVIIEIK